MSNKVTYIQKVISFALIALILAISTNNKSYDFIRIVGNALLIHFIVDYCLELIIDFHNTLT